MQTSGYVTSMEMAQQGIESTASQIRVLDALPASEVLVSDDGRRTAWKTTPALSQNPLLSLSHPRYGLPEDLVANFVKLGVESIYPWQSSCLLGRGLLSGEKNLVYTAPTGGGKSLVADVLMLKRVIENPEKKAILVLPYVALVQEKLKWLRRVVEGLQKNASDARTGGRSFPFRPADAHRDIRVAGFFGGSKARYTFMDVDIAVCTIEKVANSILNTAIEEHDVSQLAVICLDEFHMIQDPHRGYLLELMATKLLSLDQPVQVIGMSATLSNTELLAKWLDAKYYESKFKPIPIEEFLVYENGIYPASVSNALVARKRESDEPLPETPPPKPSRVVVPSEHLALKTPLVNAVVALAFETVHAGYGALIFCSSRKGCEQDAALVSQVMPAEEELDRSALEARQEVLNDLRNTAVGLDHTLEHTILRGVAFHHAGLTTEEREIVSLAFDAGVLRVIVATCSLAAGINLPARRVILHGARMGREMVGPALLRQMKGRAGRKGKDEVGETYLCCQKSDLDEVAQLLEADLPAVESGLTGENRGIQRGLLEVIATRLATSKDALNDYMNRSLVRHVAGDSAPPDVVATTLEHLKSVALVTEEPAGRYQSTQLGHAIVAAALAPDDGLFIHEEMERAVRSFVMDGEMHIFYTFTPIQSTSLGEINWRVFRTEVDLLDESGIRVMRCVGVNPSTVNKLAQGGSLRETTADEIKRARTYRRFYAALQLRDLCNEMPIHQVATKYDIPRGAVQNLAQTCDGFAAGMIKFCQRMQWGMLGAVLEHTSDRLKAGARNDLLDLARIAFVKSRTARVMWENGLKTVRAVAEADPTDLIPILLQAQPRKLRLRAEEEEKYRAKIVLKAEIIVKSAERVWSQQMRFDDQLDN
ncbi:MAG: hypothetical protein M1826_006885 [Phylliscum demangeonii]|nr:MAG: hypothetical protein M1826_006885 [Phylliscum demangeonii]